MMAMSVEEKIEQSVTSITHLRVKAECHFKMVQLASSNAAFGCQMLELGVTSLLSGVKSERQKQELLYSLER